MLATKRNLAILSLALLAIATDIALAQLPPLPPMTNGNGNPADNGMKHALVGFDGAQLTVHVADPPRSPVTMISGIGAKFDTNFDVLEDRYFNSQHGWLPDGILVPPPGAEIWIRRTGLIAPAGATLKIHEGGMGNVMPSWTMQEIYSADGDIWKWDRIMQHDLFVADKPGEYSMSFQVYFGNATTGAPLPEYGSAETSLSFRAPVPEPASIALLLVALVAPLAYRQFAGN